MRIIRILLILLFAMASTVNYANEDALSQMYDLANQTVSQRSEEQHLKDINSVLLQAANDQHVAALANILKADYYIFQEDFTKAEQFLVKAKPAVDLIQSDKLNNEYQFAQIFLMRSNSDIDGAIEIGEGLYKKVIESWPKHKLSHLVLELAYVKSFKYKYDEALQLMEKALDYSYESDDPFQIAETYNMFGILYSELNDETSANRYYQKAVEVLEKNPGLSTNTYLYTNLADSYRELKEYDQAIRYLDKSEAMAKADKDDAAISFAYQMRGRLLTEQKNYQEAVKYLLQAEELTRQIGEKLFRYEIHSEIAYAYLKLDQLDKAEHHLIIAEENAGKQSETDKYFIENIRALLLFKKGNYKDAYDALSESYDNYVKQFNADLTRVSNLSREQLDQAQLNYDNKLLARENELNAKNAEESRRFNLALWVLVALLVLSMLVLFWFMYRFRKLAIKNKKLALTDNLTRMPNRRHIFRKLGDYHSQSEQGKFSYSVIIFDIDHFKAINDKFGHSIGDKVIQATKDICQLIVRDSDTIGRIGGEEFLVILPETAVEDAYRIAERIREQFENYDFEALAKGLKVTSSFGVTEYTSDDDNLDLVINRADRLLYKAKHEGRNKVFANLVQG
ncbi:MAG: GGDEF domain-containing protein [Gammaproteobacteria bacterium]|nr:GGDEF domain-containing protein [Gammaproteobacteria bacterium]